MGNQLELMWKLSVICGIDYNISTTVTSGWRWESISQQKVTMCADRACSNFKAKVNLQSRPSLSF